MAILEILKVFFIGIVEGVTEWLPISSTGHMLLVDYFLKLDASQEFKDMFFVVIQLGAIMAVVILYWKKLWPFRIIRDTSAGGLIDESDDHPLSANAGRRSSGNVKRSAVNKRRKNEIYFGSVAVNKSILQLWLKVIIATIPAAVMGLLLDDWMDKYAHTPGVIAVALIVYGILFILVEDKNETRKPRLIKLSKLTYKDALFLGLFQTLAIVPGTSRSGATIVGGLSMGISRKVAAEFSFFMSIPIMFGWSLVKIIKFGLHFSGFEILQLLLGMIVSFAVSIFVIKFLMGYIKKHDFKIFGYYRIILGLLMIIVSILIKK